jgi:hypothetical protein
MTIDDHSLVWSSVAVLQGSSIGVVGVPEWEIGHPSDADPIMPFKTSTDRRHHIPKRRRTVIIVW